MPVRTRTLRENDENSQGSTRVTRAKAASLSEEMPAKALQTKKSSTNVNASRRRAALGDVSNVKLTKSDAAEGKKTVAGRSGLVSKAAQPTGVQKKSAGRTALGTKQVNKKVESKHDRSGAGAIGIQKRKVATSTAVIAVVEEVVEEGEPLRKKKHVEIEPPKEIEKDDITRSSSHETQKDDIARSSSHETQNEVAVVKPAPVVSAPVFDPQPTTSTTYPDGVQDLDTEDLDDPLMVAEYTTEIFEYLRDLECESVPNPDYMSHQDDLEWKTRGILIDWLIEVHTRFHLLPETLFLAVNIIDRFLSQKVVQLDRLQLVGITAMFIASKYEEVLSPHIANFRHVADDGFSEQEILSAERFILQTLNYNLSFPNPMNFLRRVSKADNYDIQSRTIGKYLMEISLLDHRFMAHRPSHVAAAAMYLARLILDRGEWDETIEFYSGYSEQEIEPVFVLMVDYLARPVIHEAFFKKYASKKFLKASIMTRHWAKRNALAYGITDTDRNLDQISV